MWREVCGDDFGKLELVVTDDWVDRGFGTDVSSITGVNTGPKCRCGKVATMVGDVWRCNACNFTVSRAAWSARASLTWARLATPVFGSGGLVQGALGDCWFLSALSVVAQRPDLVRRLLLPGKNAHAVRLFLDGEWKTVVVDDRFPVKGSRLAFVACDDGALWAPLLEKAYAKAHGSYAAISGGQIAEALRDLTGASTLSLDVTEDLWEKMIGWASEGLPMGAGTDSNTLEGLPGWHAYSILALKEEGRLVRIRDPHGRSRYAGLVGDDDFLKREVGVFVMRFETFCKAFSRLDVCLAWGDHHARSFPSSFPKKGATTRACAVAVSVENPHDGIARVAVAALQPTKRGAWCRSDRKVSYTPGDVSIVVVDDDLAVLASSFRGADLDTGSALLFDLAPSRRCTVYTYALGANPTATQDPDLYVRVTSDRSFRYSTTTDVADATPALHAALSCLSTTQLDPGVSYVVRKFDGLAAVVGLNRTDAPVALNVTIFAKSCIARDADDARIANDADAAAIYAADNPDDSAAFRWPAKWMCFATSKPVPARSRRLLAVVARTGIQWSLGDVRVATCASTSSDRPQRSRLSFTRGRAPKPRPPSRYSAASLRPRR